VTAPLRVVIADDHPPTRAAVGEALEGQDCEVVAAVGTAADAVAAGAVVTYSASATDTNPASPR
jgi:DNA-binding NarL/FixJ family response regulator